ncbi:cobalamin biosynthesis protein CobW [biofilm metagenome]
MTELKIPVTVIGGYLGAGKTTLLNSILRNSQGIRYAVLVNDFGSINIDAALIESQEDEVINLANGCICCSMAGGLTNAMFAIRERELRPDRVLIEASGVSDPHKIAQNAYLPDFCLDSILVLADAELIRKHAKDKYVAKQVVQQLKSADLLLLTKLDLISDELRRQVTEWLKDLAPEIRIIEVDNGRMPLELLFADDTFTAHSKFVVKSILKPDESNFEHSHEEMYAKWAYTGSQPLDGVRFRQMISALENGILRGKGFLFLAEDQASQYIFQLVGKRWTITKDRPWDTQQPMNRFVLIGLPGSFDSLELEQQLKLIEESIDSKSNH